MSDAGARMKRRRQTGRAVSATSHPRLTTTRSEMLAEASRELEGFAALTVVSGEVSTLTADGERSRVVEGDALLLGPGARCCLRSLVNPCEVLLLDADPSWTDMVLHLSSAKHSHATLASAVVSRAASPIARRVRQLLRELLAPERCDEEPNGLHRVRAVMELLAFVVESDAASSLPSGPTQAGAASRSAFMAAVAALEEAEALEDTSIGALATSLGLSERQVSRLFRLELGTTFSTFMTRLRVARARRLLAASTLPVIQIAAETGWGSLAHFNSVFRRLTGRTPTAYRHATFRDQ
jgi:AraC-like DNA-binding protein